MSYQAFQLVLFILPLGGQTYLHLGDIPTQQGCIAAQAIYSERRTGG